MNHGRIFLLSFIFVMIFFAIAHAKDKPSICFKDNCVAVEIVNTPQAMQRGLSGHAPLANNQGMLFIFDEPGTHGFWMKEMTFNLDVLWLNEAGKIVDIKENLVPCTIKNCPVYKPASQAQYVLEVNGGYIKSHGLQLGQNADFRNISK